LPGGKSDDEVNRIVSGEDSDDENYDNHFEFNNLSLIGIEQVNYSAIELPSIQGYAVA